MRDHIYKENNILYPCAEDVLTPEEMNAMGEKCSEIKGVKPCVLTPLACLSQAGLSK